MKTQFIYPIQIFQRQIMYKESASKKKLLKEKFGVLKIQVYVKFDEGRTE